MFLRAIPLPHGRTALDAIRELDLDSWDLAVWIQVLELLRDVRNGCVDSAVASFDILPLESGRDLLDEGHLFAFLQKRCNDQQALDLGGLLWSRGR